MARSSELNSATSQYYFNLVDNVALDTSSGSYAMFGKIVFGIEVLDAMINVKTTTAYGLWLMAYGLWLMAYGLWLSRFSG